MCRRMDSMEGRWVRRPLNELYDVAHVQSSLKSLYGIDFVTNLSAYKPNVCRGAQQLSTCHARPHEIGDDEMGYYQRQIETSIGETWQQCVNDGGGNHNKETATVLLECGHAYEQWRYNKLPPSIPANLHKALQFSERIRGLAADIIRSLGGENKYNSMHLRLEGDSNHWIRACSDFVNDTPSLYWSMFYQAAANLGFDNALPVYVTVGPAELSNKMASIFKDRFASKIFNKFDLLPREKLEGLGVDQLAAIDFVVLLHAEKAIGFPFSTYSAYLQSARHLQGYHPTRSFQMADGAGLLWRLGRVGYGTFLEKLYNVCWSFFDTRIFSPDAV